MRFAADLHLHSRFASGVSPAMTLENIALWAQRKGVDLLGTGDCLQSQWLAEIEADTIEAEPGLLALKPEVERQVHSRLPAHLRRSLRFVLSTEVNCVSPGRKEMEGLHQLLYFPSIASVREFSTRIRKWGALDDGRPMLAISARTLLKGTRNFERVHQVPAHVMNPWFSALGVIGGETNLETVYEDELPRLLAVETGLTSNPRMCRRVSGMDRLGLLSCSDAHSLENIGRECTLVDIEPGYDALMAALRDGTRQHGVEGTLKFPLELTRYFLNWCSACKESFDTWPCCPRCGKALTMGSRDRLQFIARDRPEPTLAADAPPFKTLRPLAYVIAKMRGKSPDSVTVRRLAGEIVDKLGHEREVLTEIELPDLIRGASPEIAQEIYNQRVGSAVLQLGQSDLGF